MTTNQNTIALKCRLLLLYATMNHFLIGLWRAMKNGFYMTTGDDPLTQWLDWEEAPKHFLKPALHPRKVMVTVWLPVRSLQLSESWQNHYIWEVCSASWWRAGHDWAAEPNCTENCNACNWHRSTEWAQFYSTTPDHTSHNQHLRSWTNWAIKILPHLPYSPDFLPTDYHFLKHLDNFLQGKCFYNQQEAENAF